MTEQAQKYRQRVNSINKVVSRLQRIGIAFGPMQMLTVAGRRTGEPRTFPIAVLHLAGGRYVVQAFPKAAWVANVRAADTVRLSRGRRATTARLVEVPVEERRPLLRELAATQPASAVRRFVTTGLASEASADGLAAAAERIALFRIEPV